MFFRFMQGELRVKARRGNSRSAAAVAMGKEQKLLSRTIIQETRHFSADIRTFFFSSRKLACDDTEADDLTYCSPLPYPQPESRKVSRGVFFSASLG